jgi:prevent-host-death family protein
MHDMTRTSVTVRELHRNLKQVLTRVERGEVIEVTNRRRLVARLTPAGASAPISPWPDLASRARAVFGDRVVDPGAVAAVEEGRGDR